MKSNEKTALREFAEWIVSLDDDDPESPGRIDRKTVGLNQIVQRAQRALDETPVSDTTAATITPADRLRVLEVLSEHRIECTGLGEVTCFGCRDKGWMDTYTHRQHQADAVLAALGLTVTDETGAEK